MSIASEITRIQSAKTALKTSINAKTDSQHQITNETIDDYSSFVDSITGGGVDTGAYKVSSVLEMNALTGMNEGDYCVITKNNIPIPFNPETANYTKLSFETVKEIVKLSSAPNTILETHKCTAVVFGTKNGNKYTPNQIQLDFVPNSTYSVVKYQNILTYNSTSMSNVYEIKYDPSDKTITGGTSRSWQMGNFVFWDRQSVYPVQNPWQSSKYVLSSFAPSTGFTLTGGWNDFRQYTTDDDWGVVSFESSNYSLYEYIDNNWVDQTEVILVPSTTITPTTSSQTPSIPEGYRGFKNITVSASPTSTTTVTPSISQQVLTPSGTNVGFSQVTVNAVTSAIDNNIQAENIKDGISILGVLGEYQGADTGAYKVNSVSEMNNLVGMQNGDYCIIEGSTNVPSAFTEVEYIESSGSQYINTTVIGKSSLKVEGKIKTPSSLSSFKAILGSSIDASGDSIRVFIQTSNNGAGWSLGAKTNNNSGSVVANTVYEIEANFGNNSYLKANNSTVATITNTSAYTTNTNMTLFARNVSNTLDNYSSHRLYYLKIYDNNVLIRDFIPAVRKSNNTVGLYDKVNGVLYTNAGSGTFTKGPDVQSMEIYRYNGTSWVQA